MELKKPEDIFKSKYPVVGIKLKSIYQIEVDRLNENIKVALNHFNNVVEDHQVHIAIIKLWEAENELKQYKENALKLSCIDLEERNSYDVR